MSLLSPVYLLGLVSVVIPVWLHLIHKENPQILEFASRMFLEPTPIASNTQKKLQFKKLLLTRLALLMLLVLLFAQPVIIQVQQWLENDSSLHAVVIDRSFSMRQGERWNIAIQRAKELLSDFPESDRAVVLTADQKLSVIAEASSDKGRLNSALSSLEAGYGRLAYATTMTQLESFVDEADLPVRIHLITDVQSSGMPRNIRDIVPKGMVSLNIVNVGDDSDDNAFIHSARVIERKGEGDVRVYIGGLDRKELSGTSVSLSADNQDKRTSTLVVNPDGKIVANFTAIPFTRGNNRFVVQLENTDSLSEDNLYYLGYQSGRSDKVHFMGQQKNTISAVFLRTGLSTDERYFADSQVETDEEIPQKAVLVIVPDESDLSSSEKEELARFVRKGGNALIVSGFNSNTLPSQIQQNTPRQDLSIGYVDTAHPLILDRASWQEINVFRSGVVENRDSDRVIVALSDGSPFIVERNLGEGRQIIVASALDGTFNDFPTSRIFAPFIRQLVRNFAETDEQLDRLSSGSRLVVEPGGQLISPSGENLVPFTALGEENTIELPEPGIYELKSAERSGLVSVNIDPQESSLKRLDSQFILEWEALANKNRRSDTGISADTSSNNRTFPLTAWLLPTLLVLILLEILYANNLLNTHRGVQS